MALEQKLTVKMSQRLIMTPSLQQAIKLLQMSKLELVDEIQQELTENPVLDEVVGDATPEERAEADAATAEDPSPDERRTEEREKDPYEEIDYESYFQDVDGGWMPRAPVDSGEELPSFENTLAEQQNLADHLLWQLGLAPASEKLQAVGAAIVGNLNEDGYLRAGLDEIQQMGGWTVEEVREGLALIQGFDPVGVAARDLVECLTLQLRHLGQEGTPAETIVRFHMDKLQGRKYRELAETLGLDMDDLQAELEIIRGLDPRPGQKYNVESSRYVVPDVYVVKIDDDYQILLNEEGLPRLRISPVYRRMVERGAQATSSEAKEYVRDKLRSAFRLIKSLEERQRTIYKVARSIVKFQRDFLDYGIERLRPLVLKDVADDIGMHESTVSRVVNNKYMHTHRGLYEMRFFFHSGIASIRGGESVSSLTVKDRIKKIVVAEDARHPLSDAAIVKILKAEGLQIARRTVAKYREELKIPSSSSRKQVFH
jgi:RNA polymerase sigma-54 factor